jgi:formylglycine-generating enzyme required for sulfatase activity
MRVIRAAPALVLVAIAACNAISGASDITVCNGDCGGQGLPGRTDDGGGGEAGPPGPTPVCNEGDTKCDGLVAMKCVDNAWQSQTCPIACEAGACVSYKSCRSATGTGCGKTPADCCTTANVPSATFKRRNSNAWPATVSTFDLDVFEVTVGRFRAFVDAGGATVASPPAVGAGEHPKNPGSGWQTLWNAHLPADVTALKKALAGGTWTDTAGAQEHLPITNVPWLLAFAFCAWDEARLPTYAEWDLAAAGGAEQRIYPWSSPPTSLVIDATRSAYNCGYSAPAQSCSDSCNGDGSTPCDGVCTCQTVCTGCDAAKDIAPVGMLPAGAGAYGHFDLAGNAAEMLLDISDPPAPPPLTPCIDCSRFLVGDPDHAGAGVWAPANGRPANFIVAGGSWSDDQTVLRITGIQNQPWKNASPGIGFRCARH